jgi:hypothetical protein
VAARPLLLRLSSHTVSIDVELARRQWEEAQRRVDAAAGDRVVQERLLREIEVVSEELRRRVGATFTLAELAGVYAGADRWAQDAIQDRVEHRGSARTASLAADAAFHRYARGASDYSP